METEIISLQEQLEMLQADYESMLKLYETSKATVHRQRKQIAILMEEADERETEVTNKYKDELKFLKGKMEELKEQLEEQQTDYEKQTKALKHEQKKQLDSLAEQHADEMRVLEDTVVSQQEALTEVSDELDAEREAFEQEKAIFNIEDAHQTKMELERIQERYAQLRPYVDDLERTNKQLKNNLDDVAYISENVTFLQQQLQQKQELIQQYKEAAFQWEHLQSLRDEYDEISIQNKAIKAENLKLRDSLQQLRIELEEKQEKAEILEHAERQRAFYLYRTRNLEREIQRYQKREQEAVSDENRVFESFQMLIETSQKTPNQVDNYPGDQVIKQRIIETSEAGNYEFSLDMVEGFLAAMRSSRFIILKGLSGTGKTSLPKIVAHALGGVCETIAVQPNWKSKTDLIGFYNHFNERFMPTPFTEELFKARLPENRDKFYFIVLDEMNLARVEYYFSDFNSKLELEESKQVIELFDTMGRTSGTLSEYIDGGNKLKIPSNVFFIGTINEDDSTYTLSDKIYDRAQVLDFQAVLSDKIGNMEKVKEHAKMPAVSFVGFKKQREVIEEQNVDREMQRIEKVLSILSENLDLQIGNRPRRHIRAFLQAYAANNWNKDVAIDLQIVSKIVPKIMPSYDDAFVETMDKLEGVVDTIRKQSLAKKAFQKVKRNAR